MSKSLAQVKMKMVIKHMDWVKTFLDCNNDNNSQDRLILGKYNVALNVGKYNVALNVGKYNVALNVQYKNLVVHHFYVRICHW